MPWDPLKQNHSMVLKHGFKPEANPYSFDPYERAGSSVYYQIHDLLKFERLGYRKITDHCTREIRHGRLTRTEAVKIESNFINNKINIKPFFKWLNVNQTGIDWFLKHRLNKSTHLISDSQINYKTPNFPNRLKSMLSDTSKPEKEFITYGKGIKI